MQLLVYTIILEPPVQKHTPTVSYQCTLKGARLALRFDTI